MGDDRRGRYVASPHKRARSLLGLGNLQYERHERCRWQHGAIGDQRPERVSRSEHVLPAVGKAQRAQRGSSPATLRFALRLP